MGSAIQGEGSMPKTRRDHCDDYKTDISRIDGKPHKTIEGGFGNWEKGFNSQVQR